LLELSHRIHLSPRPCVTFHNRLVLYGGELLASYTAIIFIIKEEWKYEFQFRVNRIFGNFASLIDLLVH
jgi:hypothetical protein